MEEVAFFIGAIGALGAAAAVVALKNPFYSVLALVIHLVFLAGIFLLLMAQFLAASLIVVYAGAVMVLYVFVAAYVGGIEEPKWDASPELRVIGPIMAVSVPASPRWAPPARMTFPPVSGRRRRSAT